MFFEEITDNSELTVMGDISSLDFEEVVSLNMKLHYFFGNLYPEFNTNAKIIEYVVRATIFVGE